MILPRNVPPKVTLFLCGNSASSKVCGNSFELFIIVAKFCLHVITTSILSSFLQSNQTFSLKEVYNGITSLRLQAFVKEMYF